MPAGSSSSPHPPSRVQGVLLTLLLLLLSLSLLFLRILTTYLRTTRKSNLKHRRALIARLGLPNETRIRRYTILGFFHPYCNAGGGGERVLFEAMRHHLQQEATICVVYTGDVTASHSLRSQRPRAIATGTSSIADGGGGMATSQEILHKAASRFHIHLETYTSRIAFLPVSSRRLVSDKYWKRLTLLGQSFGSLVLAKEACEELIPDVFIDTMGYAFTFPVVRAYNRRVPIGAYVHYPTISTDMLQRVKSRKSGHTNDAAVAGSVLRSHLKLLYYRGFAWLYAWALRRSDVIVANGSWTRDHINGLILSPKQFVEVERIRRDPKPGGQHSLRPILLDRQAMIVYPPCDTLSLQNFPLERRGNLIVSLAQFRPEKEHRTQLLILRGLFDRFPHWETGTKEGGDVKLVMMGSSRNAGDEARIEDLKRLVKELRIEQHVTFTINAPYTAILSVLSQASIGLSTMVDEHFGINVVEFLAAGLLTLSHASAGPFLDIAVPDPSSGEPTGFHATDVEQFVQRLDMILAMGEEQRMQIRARARRRAVHTFGAEAFRRDWDRHLWQRLKAKLPFATSTSTATTTTTEVGRNASEE